MERVHLCDVDALGGEHFSEQEWFPIFVNYPPQVAFQNGWVRNVREYQTFAALVFAYRYPAHPLAREVRAQQPEIDDDAIVRMMRG